MTEFNSLAGVDFGAKLAGTTSMTILQKSTFNIHDCKKGEDADVWLLKQIEDQKIKIIFMDAPLSLPSAYLDKSSGEFFYRNADTALGAMSPMFLGGVTARAMKLKWVLNQRDITVFETYPAALVRTLLPNTQCYKKDIQGFRKELRMITKALDLPALPSFSTFHQVDSLLAWLSGYRHLTQQSISVGVQQEGLIFI